MRARAHAHTRARARARIWCPEAEKTVEHRAYDKSVCFSSKIRTDVEETIEFQAYNATQHKFQHLIGRD